MILNSFYFMERVKNVSYTTDKNLTVPPKDETKKGNVSDNKEKEYFNKNTIICIF